MPNLCYIVIETRSLKTIKPTYEVYDIIPKGLPSTLPTATKDQPTVYEYFSASVIYQSENLSEQFTIRLRWTHDGGFAKPSVVEFDEDKAEAEKKMGKKVDEFIAQEGSSKTMLQRFDDEFGVKSVEGLKTVDGENVWFEIMQVDMKPTKTYESGRKPTAYSDARMGKWIYDEQSVGNNEAGEGLIEREIGSGE